MIGTRLSSAGAALLVVALAPVASAQLRERTAPVLAPGVPLSAPDDASAVDLNPSALGFLDAWSLTYVHVEADDDQALARAGDAARLGLPLPFGLALGASIQSVRPSGPGAEEDRGIGSLALGFAPSRSFGVGAALRWYGSRDGSIHGLTVLDLAASWRPAPSLALSLLGRDLNGPIGLAGIDLPASFVLAVGLRPAGTRVLTLDVAGGVDTDGRVGLRGAANVAVPYVGRLVASAELDGVEDDPTLLVTAGLEVSWGGLGAGGGAVFGDGFGDSPGWWVGARLEGVQRPGIPTRRYVADVEVRSSVDERGLLGLVVQLDRVLHDDRAAGVLLRFRSTGMGTAYAQELRLMIEALEAAGKPVVCHLDAGSGAEWYACAAATKTFLDPAGGVRLAGPHVQVIFLGELMRNAGLRAEFVRIGRFKSAPEQLTNERSSAPATLQRRELYDDVYERLTADLSRDFDVPAERAEELVDGGPYVTPEAVALGLVAGTADELDLDATLEDAFGDSYPRRAAPRTESSRRWGAASRVGVVVVDGDIVDGDNVDIPLIGIHMSGGRTVSRAIERLAADPTVAAIVLRVDSPGGSALASDQIWRAVMRARRKKPVIASMGAIAASGGYYVASAAEEIWADPSTVTGSIGIFFGKVDVSPLAGRLGITIEHYGRGDHAGLESMWRPFTPAERALVADKIRIWYRLFLRRVAAGRGMEVDEVHEVAQGRVWSGDAAVGIGLVDRLGGFGNAIARARALGGLDDDAPSTIVPARPSGLLDYVLGVGEDAAASGAVDRAGPALPPELRSAAAVALSFTRVREGVPVARMGEIVVIE